MLQFLRVKTICLGQLLQAQTVIYLKMPSQTIKVILVVNQGMSVLSSNNRQVLRENADPIVR
jgi:hypothetical protein